MASPDNLLPGRQVGVEYSPSDYTGGDTIEEHLEGIDLAIGGIVTDDGITGDVWGTLTTTRIEKIQGNVVNSPSPSSGQGLVYSGSPLAWRNSDLAGDVTGRLNANSVTKLRGRTVSSSSPSSGAYLRWSGTEWNYTYITGHFTLFGGMGSGVYKINPILPGGIVLFANYQNTSGITQNPTTGVFTVDSTGMYSITSTLSVSSTYSGVNGIATLGFSGFSLEAYYPAVNTSCTVTYIGYLAAGSIFSIGLSNVTAINNTGCMINAHRLPLYPDPA